MAIVLRPTRYILLDHGQLSQQTKGNHRHKHIRLTADGQGKARLEAYTTNPDFTRALPVPARTCLNRYRKGSGMGPEKDGIPDAWIGLAW